MAKRVLIADDSVTIQKAFAMTFAGADDVTVTGARTADEGLALAQRAHPDLVIADGVMPGRSGYDLCASIKADPALRAVPVYILASQQQPYDDVRGQKVGADGQLMKPWETNAMMERVRGLLGVPGAARPAPSVGAPAAVPSHRPAASIPVAAADDDDEYGEISIDTGRDTAPTAPRPRAATPAPPLPPPPSSRISSPSMPAIHVTPPPPAAHHAPAPAAHHAPAAAAHHAPAPAAHHAPAPAAHHVPPPPAPPPASPATSPGMRPSLIPGMRPGSMPARPGTAPVRPLAGPAPGPALAPPRPAAQPVGRTLMGVPAANVPIPGVMRPSMPGIPSVPSVPAAPPPAPPPRAPTGPVPSLETRPRLMTPPPRAPAAPSPAAVSASVDQKLAAIAAKGPEYEAIAKLSREVIEQVVWEIVPELAEAIIREHLEKRGRI
jgi:DNA-binding response OmpR family regulator